MWSKLLLIVMLALKLVPLYFAVVWLFALKRPKPLPRVAPKTRFACLIAARNEEAVIARSVGSLLMQDYPRSLFDVYVIPNNCTDHTAEVACSAGAKLLCCRGPVHSKGDALGEAFRLLLAQDYDAFCVLDADNEAAPDLLFQMNRAFCDGAKAVKSRIAGREPGRSAISGCYAVYHTLFNHWLNLGKENLRLPARLVGTGFALHRELLTKLGGWHTVTLAEDAEIGVQCARMGERVRYVPEAVTYDEAPGSIRLSLRQRHRWCAGIQETGRRNLGALARSCARSPLALDGLLTLLAPFCQLAGLAVMPLTLLCLPGEGLWLMRSLPLGALSALLMMLVAGFVLARQGGLRLRSLMLFPLFMLSWLPLQAAAFLCPPKSWKPIPHGACLNRLREQAGHI